MFLPLAGELTNVAQDLCHCLKVCIRTASKGGQDAVAANSSDHLPGFIQSQRRWPHREIPDCLHENSTEAKSYNRSKAQILPRADDDFPGLSADHFFHQHSIQARRWIPFFGLSQNILKSAFHFRGTFNAQANHAGFRLVEQVGGRELESDRTANAASKRAGLRDAPSETSTGHSKSPSL